MSIVLKQCISNGITPATGVARDIADGTSPINFDAIHQLWRLEEDLWMIVGD